MSRGNLVIISGPSGAGKGTLVKGILGKVPDLWVSVSATTRAPRPLEVDGVHYFFLTKEEFDVRLRNGEFLEWAEVHGNRYGTLRGPVERRQAVGMNVILEIDPQGAAQVKEKVPDAVLVFIKAPTRDDYAERIRARGAETPEQVETRMRTAERELELEGMYDHVVINDDVSRATDELARFVSSLPKKD